MTQVPNTNAFLFNKINSFGVELLLNICHSQTNEFDI